MFPGSRLNAFQNAHRYVAQRTYPSVKYPSFHVIVSSYIKRVQLENVCVRKSEEMTKTMRKLGRVGGKKEEDN